MSDVTTKYDVRFINHFEDYDELLVINFTCTDPKDVDNIISALSSHYSGDPYECFINGDKAVLESDFGLLRDNVN